jgi:hypothetical protein
MAVYHGEQPVPKPLVLLFLLQGGMVHGLHKVTQMNILFRYETDAIFYLYFVYELYARLLKVLLIRPRYPRNFVMIEMVSGMVLYVFLLFLGALKNIYYII